MLNTEQKRLIAAEAIGTCLSYAELMERVYPSLEGVDEVTSDEIEEATSDYAVYRCNTCGWWHDEGEIWSPEECQECHDGN